MPEACLKSSGGAASARVLRALVVAVILLAGLAAAWVLTATGPQAERRPRQADTRARLVEIATVESENMPARVEGMGTVLPSREVTLRPRVSGVVTHRSENLIPGGRVQKNELLLRIDPTDYILARRQRESDLAQAEANLRMEHANRAVAIEELELLGEEVDEESRDLVLRGPQLQAAKAQVESARAALDRARKDLERSVIRAPFNALITDRFVDVGTNVSTSADLARLIGVDEYWVEVALPLSQLRWITPEGSARRGTIPVRIYNPSAWGAGAYREGVLREVLGTLETKARMARVLVSIPDPRAMKSANHDVPELLIGSYVRAVFDGNTLANVVKVSRSWLEGPNEVWVMDEEDNLDIRSIEILFSTEDSVFVGSGRGLSDGDRVVTSPLATPVQGMPLRTRETKKNEGDSQAMEPSTKSETSMKPQI